MPQRGEAARRALPDLVANRGLGRYPVWCYPGRYQTSESSWLTKERKPLTLLLVQARELSKFGDLPNSVTYSHQVKVICPPLRCPCERFPFFPIGSKENTPLERARLEVELVERGV